MAKDQDSEELPKPKGSKLNLIVVGVLALGLAGDLSFRAIDYFKGTSAAAADEEDSGGEGEEGYDDEAGEGHRPKVKSTFDLEAFLVNLADTDQVRFVKATFVLGLNEEHLGEELKEDPVTLAATRDSIVAVLSAKHSDEILTTEGKTKLREEIRKKVNGVLPKGKVRDVFIVDFVVQL